MSDNPLENFTLVFSGNIRDFKMNPFTTETPWGIPHSVSLGDALVELDNLREKIEETRK